jgi:hypothetical protein
MSLLLHLYIVFILLVCVYLSYALSTSKALSLEYRNDRMVCHF